jgi:CRISPR/Cas system-associated exonuclease Cas4 (RecB family)
MKTVFDIIKDITVLKPKYQLLPSDDFVPYMVQRWLSMVHPSYCSLMNDIYNDKISAFMDEQQLYDFLKCIIPKKAANQIKYIKKSKAAEKSKHENVIEELANSLELSKKEVMEMLSICPEILDEAKEKERVLKKN